MLFCAYFKIIGRISDSGCRLYVDIESIVEVNNSVGESN